jgi:hypothetical protein
VNLNEEQPKTRLLDLFSKRTSSLDEPVSPSVSRESNLRGAEEASSSSSLEINEMDPLHVILTAVENCKPMMKVQVRYTLSCQVNETQDGKNRFRKNGD